MPLRQVIVADMHPTDQDSCFENDTQPRKTARIETASNDDDVFPAAMSGLEQGRDDALVGVRSVTPPIRAAFSPTTHLPATAVGQQDDIVCFGLVGCYSFTFNAGHVS